MATAAVYATAPHAADWLLCRACLRNFVPAYVLLPEAIPRLSDQLAHEDARPAGRARAGRAA